MNFPSSYFCSATAACDEVEKEEESLKGKKKCVEYGS